MHRVAAVLVMMCMTSGAAAQDPPGPPPPVPSVVTTGEARITRAPDQAFVTLAVETRARAPRDAQRQNAEAMASVQQRLAQSGLPRDAMRTTGYAIEQEFDFTNGRRVPRGYVARNGIEVRVDAVERVGDLLDAVVEAGATTVTGVRFDLKERAAAEREALRLAVVDARGRAEALAAGAGRTVDRVLRISDAPRRGPEPMFDRPMLRVAAAAASPEATPIQAGLIEIHAVVELTAALR